MLSVPITDLRSQGYQGTRLYFYQETLECNGQALIFSNGKDQVVTPGTEFPADLTGLRTVLDALKAKSHKDTQPDLEASLKNWIKIIFG